MSRDPNSAQTAEKAMEVLKVVGRNSRPLTLAEVIHETDYSPTTVQRILRALEKSGAVTRNEGTSRYQIGWLIRGLQSGHEWHDTLKAVALPQMLDLQRRCGGMTVGLYVLVSPWQFTCVETCPGSEGLQHIEQRYRPITMGVGATSLVFLAQLKARYGAERMEQWLGEQAHGTAVGSASIEELMARVDETARTGTAFTHGTRFVGMSGMSSPISDGRRRIIAALSVSGLEDSFHRAEEEGWSSHLRRACSDIEKRHRATT